VANVNSEVTFCSIMIIGTIGFCLTSRGGGKSQSRKIEKLALEKRPERSLEFARLDLCGTFRVKDHFARKSSFSKLRVEWLAADSICRQMIEIERFEMVCLSFASLFSYIFTFCDRFNVPCSVGGGSTSLYQGHCSGCGVLLMFPSGASAVECARCRTVTHQGRFCN
jgi:LSD1 subclass zinc finger protein